MNFSSAKFEASFGLASQLPPSRRLEIAFAGRSNVGKSSLINRVLGRKQLARVSAVPGKTVTVNFYSLQDIVLADLPGYGYAKVSKSERDRWAELMEHYFQSGRNIGLVFQLVDMRHPPSRDDVNMVDFLIDAQIPFVVVLTKKDKLSRRQQQERLEAFRRELPCGGQLELLPFSSQTGEGVEELRQIIEDVASPEENPAAGGAAEAEPL